jgi:signal transduction histidine kinase
LSATAPKIDPLPPASPETRSVLRHLVHELRQPLSGIESIAYYLEMALPHVEPKARTQFERLRRMVRQASWILEDAGRLARPLSAHEPVCLSALASDLVDRLRLDDDCPVRLELAPGLPLVSLPRTESLAVLRNLVDLFLDSPRAEEDLTIETAPHDDGARVDVSAAIFGADASEVLRVLEPPRPAGGIRAFAESLSGELTVSRDDRGVRASLWFPACPDQAR